jgi:hypothetical protein
LRLRFLLCLLTYFAVTDAAFGQIHGLKPGQYDFSGEIQFCLKDDGTWYGTTSAVTGHWINAPVSGVVGVIFGNYGEDIGQYNGYGNMVFINTVRFDYTSWWDWHDDMSYQHFGGGGRLSFLQAKCDPPSKKRPPKPDERFRTVRPDAGPLIPGQYLLAGSQKVCLKSDGTWYGIRYPFSGNWIGYQSTGILGTLYGNYRGKNRHDYQGFGNVVVLVTQQAHQKNSSAAWLDWHDSGSYQSFEGNMTFTFQRTNCAPPRYENASR